MRRSLLITNLRSNRFRPGSARQWQIGRLAVQLIDAAVAADAAVLTTADDSADDCAAERTGQQAAAAT